MNAVTGFVAIVSLLLALATAGGAAKDQAKGNSSDSRNISPSKIVLNHNETFVQDASPTRQADDSELLTTAKQAAASAVRLLIRFFINAPGGGGCDDWGCGSNHNEMLVRDDSMN